MTPRGTGEIAASMCVCVCEEAAQFSSCVSHLSIAVIKMPWPKQHKEFIWTSRSREIRVHYGREPWQQAVGVAAGAGVWGSNLDRKHKVKRVN